MVTPEGNALHVGVGVDGNATASLRDDLVAHHGNWSPTQYAFWSNSAGSDFDVVKTHVKIGKTKYTNVSIGICVKMRN